MSVFAGVWGQGAQHRSWLRRFGNKLAHRAPDGAGHVVAGPVMMAYGAFHTNDESLIDRQPFQSGEGVLLTWDGRLDNRKEIKAALGASPAKAFSDAALVAEAYQRWGEGCLSRIVGDFALALWDAKNRKLLLARDFSGIRPLFYHTGQKALSWSSDLDYLRSQPSFSGRLDEDYILEFLLREPALQRSPFQAISAVRPGWVVEATEQGLCSRPFWSIDSVPAVRYARDSDYEGRFRELFIRSVKNRLRVNGPVFSDLSGGWDSSSIVCTAAQLIAEGRCPANQIRTASIRYDLSKSADEGFFIESVEEKIGRKGFHLPESRLQMLSGLADRSPYPGLPTPDRLFGNLYQLLRRQMEDSGARVLLRGTGGDHILYGTINYPPDLADYLSRAKLFKLHRTIRSWAKSLDRWHPDRPQTYLDWLWNGAVKPLLPWARSSLDGPPKASPLIRSEIAARLQAPDPLAGASRLSRPSDRVNADFLRQAIGLVSNGQLLQEGGYEISLPFLDRRLVEFCLGVPIQQKIRPGELRSLHRRAMREALPSAVANRHGKGRIEEAIMRAWVEQGPRLAKSLRDPIVCQLGFIDKTELQSMIAKSCHGKEIDHRLMSRVICLEHWLQNLEGSAA